MRVLNEQIDEDLKTFRGKSPRWGIWNGYMGRYGYIMQVYLKDDRLFYRHSDMLYDGHNRLHGVCKLLENSISYARRNHIDLPREAYWYMSMNDAHFYQDAGCPMWVFAKPGNASGILIPDESFYTQTVWDDEETRKLTWNNYRKEAIAMKKSGEIMPVAYFHGSPTGNHQGSVYKWNTRLKLANDTMNCPYIWVNLSSRRESMFDWNRYQLLLNLPGNQPWSVRMKNLFFTGRPVLDIQPIVTYDGVRNDPWIQFYSRLFKPYRDYIPIYYPWVPGDDTGYQWMLWNIVHHLTKSLQSPSEYETMGRNARSRIRKLGINDIYEYYVKLICDYDSIYKGTYIVPIYERFLMR